MLIGIFGVILLIVIVGAIFVNTSPQFGGNPSEESLVKIENSPNYNGEGKFKNSELTWMSVLVLSSSIQDKKFCPCFI